MPHIPWRNEARYEQVDEEAGRRKYPYFPNQAIASPRRSPENHSSTLKLGESDPVSPLRFGESTSSSSFFADDVPLVPPIVQEKPRRPRLKRSSSINRRIGRGSSFRRRRSKDMVLQKTAILQSIEQREPGETCQGTKPRRRKSLEESQELLGFRKRDPVSDKNSTDSKVHTTRLHDGNHRHHRKMTRLQRSQSPQSHAEKSLHSQRSFGSRSSSGENRRGLRRSLRSLESHLSSERKGDLNSISAEKSIHTQRSFGSRSSSGEKRRGLRRSLRSLESRSSSYERKGDLNSISSMHSQRRRIKRCSESDLQSLKTMSTSVKGTDGCCIIRPNYRSGERPRSVENRNPSKLSASAPQARPALNRSQSHKRLEAKMAKLEEIKKQREPCDDSPVEGLAKFKLKPPPSPKHKKEISEICNQADQRHRQRYSQKRDGSASSDDKDDE